jgi:ligand-binding SRPBCC domain-containing protein
MEMKRDYFIKTEVWLPYHIATVFDFFKNAENLQQITPPWLDFRIITPLPIKMEPGALIDYKLNLGGIPVSWKTEISVWEPPYRFVDSQLKGPYQKWVHTHTFVEMGGGTLMEDLVQYRVPGGLLAPLVHEAFVKRKVQEIFDYRKARILEIFERPISVDNPPLYQYSQEEIV